MPGRCSCAALVLLALALGGTDGFLASSTQSHSPLSELRVTADAAAALGASGAFATAVGVLGIRAFNYIKLQLASARLVGGIPSGSVVVEVNAVDGTRSTTGPLA